MDLMKVLDQTVRELKREVSKKVLKVPEIEIKVCEATSNEPWGPHGTIMGDIAQATRNYQEYHVIMGVLWKRLHDSGKNWRHVYKSLTVMEYLIANGAERAIDELQEQAYQIQALLDFQYIEPNGKDQGINVRKKAQSLMALINDRGKIREIRQKAAVNRDRYQGVSNTGMTFRQSSYLSTSGNYSDKDDERYGGGTSVNNIQREEERPGQDREEYRSQRETFNRDDEAEHERNEGGYANSSRGGDRSSDKSSTEGDIDEGLQYSRCSGNRGVAAAITRARTSQISQSSTGTPSVSQIPPRRELFFTINSPVDDDLDDFNPRGTSSKSTSVPVSKDEVCIQSQNAALEDLFADVEFQASFPPASFPATFSQNVPEQDYLQTSYSFSQATSRTNPIQPPTLNNTLTKEKFQPLTQAFPQASADHFNPSFASFESPKSTYTREVLDGRFHPMGDYSNNYSIKGFGSSTLGSPTKTTDNNDNLFGSLNPFCSDKPDDVMAGNQASQTNPFLSTTSSSAFWDDPLITNFVDFTIGRGQKHDQTTPLSMNEIGISMAASGAASVTRADSLPMGATALSMGMAHMSNNMGPGRSMSDLPKTN